MTSRLACVWPHSYTVGVKLWNALGLSCLAVLCGFLTTARAEVVPASTPPRSEITSVRAVQGSLIVQVRVAAGRRRVTLETRPQVQRGAWTPRRVEVVDSAQTSEQRFVIPLGANSETLRIREETEEELGLPLGFFLGTNTFAPQLQVPAASAINSGTSAVGSGTGLAVPGTAGDVSTSGLMTVSTGNFSGDTSTSVVESDIWKLDGHTVYFLNQQRGLQVIDVSNPDLPVLTGTLPLAEYGEDLYRLPATGTAADGSTWLALLTQQDCNGLASQVLLVQVKDGKPTLQGRLPVAGQIRESRLVGDTLVIAGADWFSPPPVDLKDTNGVVTGSLISSWETRTALSSFELSNPAQPIVQSPITLAASPNAILATDQFLFVATTGTRQPGPTERPAAWSVAGNHAIVAFDISGPGHQPVQSGFVQTSGTVSDKFRIGFDGATLATVSQTDSGTYIQTPQEKGGVTNLVWQWTPPNSVLETFSFADPARPVPLGQLTLVTNESVYAARFSGSRAYVVTYHQVDPLWIVDLSNPVTPVVSGHVSIPGYSTFLQPMAQDTRLLALGSDGNRTRLQLFDVADPAKPGLLSEVTLGTGWSWSEANANEKAFAVFPEAGLALLPWQGQQVQDGNAVWFQGTQLIDFDLAAGTLKARGTIPTVSQPRRADLLGNRILALSPTELTSVDPTDRDLPRVVNRLPLSTEVDLVLLAGDSLLLIDATTNPRPQVRLTRPSAPELAIATLDLDPLPVTGAKLRGDVLHLFQAVADSWQSVTRVVTNQDVKITQFPPIAMTVTNWVTTRVPPPYVELTSAQMFIREESIAGIGVISVTTNVVSTVEILPQPIATNWITTNWTVEFPPVPGESATHSLTTTWIRPEFVPQPDLVTEGWLITTNYVPQPPLRITNLVTSLVYDSVLIAGRSQVVTVRVGTDSLSALGSLPIPGATNVNSFNTPRMKAFEVAPDVMVWTEKNDGGINFVGPIYALANGARTASAANPRMIAGLLPYLYFQPAHVITVDVSHPAQPSFLSQAAIQNSATNGQYWSGSSASFLADGKVFLSHQTTFSTPSSETVTVVTNQDGTLSKQMTYQPGIYEVRQFLDVVDFADPTSPNFRDPIPLPGALAGISHAGQLVYTRGPLPGEAKDPTQYLQVGAYDGTAVSLVNSLPLPNAWPSAQWIAPDGSVWLGRPATTATNVPALETWALGSSGRFEFRGSLPVSDAVTDLNLVDGLLLAGSGSQVVLLDPAVPAGAAPVLAQPKPCSLSYDPANAAASRSGGVWLPRGPWGLWQIAPTP